MKKKISSICKCIAQTIKNKDYTPRESVLAIILIFVTGILVGMHASPKKSSMILSNNGSNNGNGNDAKKKEDKQEEVEDAEEESEENDEADEAEEE